MSDDKDKKIRDAIKREAFKKTPPKKDDGEALKKIRDRTKKDK